MTQPRFAPIEKSAEMRPAQKLDVPRPWVAHRPGDFRSADHGVRPGSGTAGPDQGYALLLAEKIAPRVVLGSGEQLDDALAVATVVAMRRAARFGRAPVMHDLEVALGLLSYLAPVTDDVAEHRRGIVGGSAHDTWHRLAAANVVPEESLSLTPSQAGAHQVNWAEVAAS